MERRLAAILTADVVGYNHLMGDNEESTVMCLKALRGEALTRSSASTSHAGCNA